MFYLRLNIFQLLWHRGFGVFRLEVLFVSLGVRHGSFAHRAGELEARGSSLSVVMLVVPCHFLQLGRLLGCLGLGLLSLETPSHSVSVPV